MEQALALTKKTSQSVVDKLIRPVKVLNSKLIWAGPGVASPDKKSVRDVFAKEIFKVLGDRIAARETLVCVDDDDLRVVREIHTCVRCTLILHEDMDHLVPKLHECDQVISIIIQTDDERKYDQSWHTFYPKLKLTCEGMQDDTIQTSIEYLKEVMQGYTN